MKSVKMSPRVIRLVLTLSCVLLTLGGVSGQEAKCATLREVFPACDCEGAVNEDGQATLDVVVVCSNKGLQSVPTPAKAYSDLIYEMRLNDNSITSLPDNILPNLNIRKLDLSGNSINSVANTTFSSLAQNLRILILSGDSNSPPPSTSFVGLSNLEEIILKDYKVQQHVDNSYFLALTGLKHLTLDSWDIESLSDEAFHGPTGLSSLTLSNQPMTALPLGALRSPYVQSVQKLTISHTPISELTYHAFGVLDNLQELDVSYNHINLLEDDCFLDVTDTLTTINLAGNILNSNSNPSQLQGLKNLPHLNTLDLSSNEFFTTVLDLSQLGTSAALKLDLSNNKITSLPANAFTGVASQLHTLDLSENQIDTIDANSFNGVSMLETLYISQLSGGQLPSSLTQAAGTLKQLYVNNYNGQNINPWSVVSDLYQLEALNLASCQLNKIEELALANLTKLKELDLSSNSISAVTQASLVGPRNTLKHLYLSNNPITRMAPCTFYEYTSFPITMTLMTGTLVCDCDLVWLWRRIKDKTITFTTGHEPTCGNTPLADKQISEFCSTTPSEPTCAEHYTTTPAPTTPQPNPSPILRLTLGEITATSITISWTLSDTADLLRFKVQVGNQYGDSIYLNDNLSISTRMVVATGLRPDTHHDFCVTAFYNNRKPVLECGNTRTVADGNGGGADSQKDSGSEEVGIIIGAVIGAVVLLALLAAIGYLVLFRKRSKKKPTNNVPIQPRNFSKAELPSMSEDSRRFARPKRPPSAGMTSDHPDGMQVVAISDGQTSSNGRVGRAHMLNSDGSYKTMSAGSQSPPPKAGSMYENDHGPLPRTPAKEPPKKDASYYNMGYRDDHYDEMEPPAKEIML